MALGDVVSVTFVQDERGWRFSAWSRFEMRIEPPKREDAERYFATAEEAAAYFAEHYYPRKST